MSVSKGQHGFTLLEILIAITILALISLAVVNVTDNAILTMDRTTEVNRNNLQIETAMSRFEWDFSQIYSPLYFSTIMNLNPMNPMGGNVNGGNPPTVNGTATGTAGGGDPYSGMNGQMNPELQNYYEQLIQRFERNEHFMGVSKEGLPIPRFYAPEKNVFEFFTSSNRRKLENTKQSHFAWVRYALAEQAQDPDREENANVPKGLKSLVRYFSADDPYDDKRLNIEDPKVKGAVLLNNVESLEFQYWDVSRKKWETSLKSIPQGENILRGIKLIVTWYDFSGNKRTAQRIFRTNWPMVPPQDGALNTAGMNGGMVTAGVNASTGSGMNPNTTGGNRVTSGSGGGF